jgi:hypothetical protein
VSSDPLTDPFELVRGGLKGGYTIEQAVAATVELSNLRDAITVSMLTAYARGYVEGREDGRAGESARD